MSRLILLDAGPLGMVSNPAATSLNDRCNLWLETLIAGQNTVALPEIADYEVRRELLRAGKTRGLRRLDELKTELLYLPLTTEVMLKAAEYWAAARKLGRSLADPHALDADAILGAQAWAASLDGPVPIIATTNPDHLTLFAEARRWEEIGSA